MTNMILVLIRLYYLQTCLWIELTFIEALLTELRSICSALDSKIFDSGQASETDDSNGCLKSSVSKIPPRPEYIIIETTLEDISREDRSCLKKRSTIPIETRRQTQIAGRVKKNNDSAARQPQ